MSILGGRIFKHGLVHFIGKLLKFGEGYYCYFNRIIELIHFFGKGQNLEWEHVSEMGWVDSETFWKRYKFQPAAEQAGFLYSHNIYELM